MRCIPQLWPSRVAQGVKNPPAMQETQQMRVQSPGQEDPLEKDMATHSSILAWRIPWTMEPGGLQSIGSQRVGHNWKICFILILYTLILLRFGIIFCKCVPKLYLKLSEKKKTLHFFFLAFLVTSFLDYNIISLKMLNFAFAKLKSVESTDGEPIFFQLW